MSGLIQWMVHVHQNTKNVETEILIVIRLFVCLVRLIIMLSQLYLYLSLSYIYTIYIIASVPCPVTFLVSEGQIGENTETAQMVKDTNPFALNTRNNSYFEFVVKRNLKTDQVYMDVSSVIIFLCFSFLSFLFLSNFI